MVVTTDTTNRTLGVATRRMTVAEFEQWQLPLDDACRYDLWDGKVIEMAPAGDTHGARSDCGEVSVAVRQPHLSP